MVRESVHFTVLLHPRGPQQPLIPAWGPVCTILGNVEFNSNNPGEIIARLIELRQEHRDLDLAIERLAENAAVDQLQLTRLKKRKLKLKDWISYLESKLIPDMDA
jgi:hypothetical protein